ncbi:MAG: sugar phosphate nucleotidyltransferase [Edaphocola sp.]
MKAIIPVAGAGTKLRPHTYTQPKALMPMAGKTILSVIVDALISKGITEYIFIIGYLGDKIQDYVEAAYPSLDCKFVTQNGRRGTGHAIWLTKELVGNDDILIVFGDTICDFDVHAITNSNVSQIGIRRVDDPRGFGVAEVDAGDEVLKVVEKPTIPKSNMAMVGVYRIIETKQLFEALDKKLSNGADADGEYHLTNALQAMIDAGVHFKAFRVNNWYDCGKKESLLETNATLLKKMGEADAYSIPEYPNSVIIPPVNIAPGCVIEHSIIGPSVSIGEYTTVKSSIIKNSIIGSFAKLDEVVLKSSIIGSDAYIHGLSQSLNIGDNTDIDLG